MEQIAHILDLLMFVAACIVLLMGFPVAFTLAGIALVFAVLGLIFGNFDFSFLSAFPQRIFGTMTNDVLIAVPLFVFMGVMLERSKVAEELLETMGQLFGTMRGGLGLSVAIVGALLAASTGIVGATVVTMGLLSLPTMLKRGYDPRLACGSIAAAGTLGQIIPPSIVLVILGDQISNAYQKAQLEMGIFSPETVSVGDLFAGALVPGLLLVGMYMIYQIAMAVLRPESSPAMPAEEGEKVSLGRILHALMPPIILIIAVLGSILAGVATPTEAAAVGAIGAILLGGYRLREDRPWPIYIAGLSLIGILVLTSFMDLRVARTVIPPIDQFGIGLAVLFTLGIIFGLAVALYRVFRIGVLTSVMESTTQITCMVFIILIGAALFSLVFRGLGGEEMVHEVLNSIPGGALGAMLGVMLLMFVLGFFLDFLEIVFVVVPLVAPVLLKMEMPDGNPMSPVWLGIMMAVNLQTSFLTPPFGFALFYLRGVAPPQVSTMDIYRGIIPFVLIQLISLVVLWYFPAIATALPKWVYG
ncbi:MAG: TRAP transporter large permease subunit [Rhodobiaceae bacterium]|nr:TRAP transporter large permease subunit [Rhodobiaceae bacterium]MCC0057178.1 TRAP transporter large permease subunit [Rhodobiaceae bacterium]